jgi:hypothetical protein
MVRIRGEVRDVGLGLRLIDRRGSACICLAPDSIALGLAQLRTGGVGRTRHGRCKGTGLYQTFHGHCLLID